MPRSDASGWAGPASLPSNLAPEYMHLTTRFCCPVGRQLVLNKCTLGDHMEVIGILNASCLGGSSLQLEQDAEWVT